MRRMYISMTTRDGLYSAPQLPHKARHPQPRDGNCIEGLKTHVRGSGIGVKHFVHN